MRLNRYIKEELVIAGYDIEGLAEKLKTECKTAIREMRAAEALLWRGTFRSSGIVSKENTRKNRQPKDTAIGLHEALDKAFLDVFGWRARSQGLICSNEYMIAGEYGHPRIIFPIGIYKCLWMPGAEDVMDQIPWWLEDVDERPHMAIKEYTKSYSIKKYREKYGEINLDAEFYDQVIQLENIRKKILIDKVKQFKYTGLKQPLSSEASLEIMVRCKSYYSLAGTNDIIREVPKLLGINYQL